MTGKFNLLEASGWDSEFSEIIGKVPPTPDYINRGVDKLLDITQLPADIVRKRARNVRRAVSQALDCEPKTVGDAKIVLQRLKAVIELQGCEASVEITDQAHSPVLEAAMPLPKMKAQPSRIRKFRVRTVTGHVRRRTLEFCRAVTRMIVGLDGHQETDLLAHYQERFTEALSGLLKRLWCLMNLNVVVSENEMKQILGVPRVKMWSIRTLVLPDLYLVVRFCIHLLHLINSLHLLFDWIWDIRNKVINHFSEKKSEPSPTWIDWEYPIPWE